MRITRDIVKRVAILVVGIFVMTTGISLSVRALIGTTPISSFPYVISIGTGLSLGTITFIVNALFIVAQYFLLKDRFTRYHLAQVGVIIVFSLFTDLTMAMTEGIVPTEYWEQFGLVILSTVILGTGVALEMFSRTSMVPGEGIVLAISYRTRIQFSKTKVMFDVTYVLLAALVSVLWFGHLDGVREGTIFAAVFVGITARYVLKVLKKAFPDPQNTVS